jgi:RNA polymerase primary sigma factor
LTLQNLLLYFIVKNNNKKIRNDLLMNKKYINYETEDTITKYFKDVKKTTPLTIDKEVELAKRIKKGDQKAIDELVTANLKFVVSIAKEYQGQGLNLSDLINEGNIGLIKAASRFDHTKGFKFISYAVWWVKQSIIQSLNDNARIVRLPVNVINRISKINKEFGNGNDNEYEILSNIKDIDEELINNGSFSLNKNINDEGGEIIDLIIGGKMNESFEDLEITDNIKYELNNILSVLDERERMIIESYFGINTDHDGMTLEAIGDKYNLTKERIRQIKEKAIRKLRNNTDNLQKFINL